MDYPRVTEVLKPFATYHGVPLNVMENAASRGTKVHAYCAAIAKGAWLPDSMIGEEFIGYVDAFRDWRGDLEVETFLVVEQRFIHEKHRYSGQVDFVIKTKSGREVLVDLKTSAKPQKTHPLQMAAYMEVLASHEIYVQEAWLVYLKKQGGYKQQVVPYKPSEVATFLSALQCWRYFHGNERLPEDSGRDVGAASCVERGPEG